MIESFVDLTYRGLALGRRIKLTEVRPSTAFVELAAPMPVGTQVAIVTDDGLALDATVTWIHEQVAGAERTPGMIVAPMLSGEAAAAWWQARVALPDDERPRQRPARSRPVTVRPRPITERNKSTTDRSPPPDHVLADDIPTVMTAPINPAAAAAGGDDGPTIIADLAARVTAAAGVDRPRPSMPADVHERPTVAMAAIEVDERRTVAMSAVDQSQLAQATMRQTGEHAVIDDGNSTMIMDAVDPATLGIDLPGYADASPATLSDEPSAPVITIEDAGDADEDGEGHDDGGGNGGAAAAGTGADKPAAGKSLKRRRKRR
ncbi:MAG: hypothetical protein ABIY55_08645 [Kofleriaceae bacterium]